PEAHAADRADHAGCTDASELAPQVLDVRIERALEDVALRQGAFDEFGAAEHPARGRAQVVKQAKLGGRKLQLGTVVSRQRSGRLDAKPADLQSRRTVAVMRPAAAQHGFHARYDLAERERLDNVVVGAK